MKQFACGDVVPGCRRTFAGTEEQILTAVAAHASADHGVTTMTDGMLDQVRGSMTPAG